MKSILVPGQDRTRKKPNCSHWKCSDPVCADRKWASFHFPYYQLVMFVLYFDAFFLPIIALEIKFSFKSYAENVSHGYAHNEIFQWVGIFPTERMPARLHGVYKYNAVVR